MRLYFDIDVNTQLALQADYVESKLQAWRSRGNQVNPFENGARKDVAVARLLVALAMAELAATGVKFTRRGLDEGGKLRAMLADHIKTSIVAAGYGPTPRGGRVLCFFGWPDGKAILRDYRTFKRARAALS